MNSLPLGSDLPCFWDMVIVQAGSNVNECLIHLTSSAIVSPQCEKNNEVVMLGSFMLFLSNGFYIYVLTNFKFQITDIQFGGSYNVEYSQTNMPTGDEISAFEDKVQIRFKSDGNPSTVGLGFSIEWTSEEFILTTAPGCKYQTFHLHLHISCDTSLHPLSIQ